MKRFLIVAAMLFGFAVAASAQPKALGLRFGYGAELSYQHAVGGANFIEADLGLGDFKYANVAATYNFMLAQPAWTDRGEWGFYAGPGVSVGSELINIDAQGHNHPYFHVSAAGMVGLEFSFWFPLQLSFDIRPQLGVWTGGGQSGFYFGGWCPALGVRYRF